MNKSTESKSRGCVSTDLVKSRGTLPVPQCNRGPFPLQQLDQGDDGGGSDDDDDGSSDGDFDGKNT